MVSALLNIGRTEFAGGMERQAKILAGAISNLDDAWDALADTIFRARLGQALRAVSRGRGMAGFVRGYCQWVPQADPDRIAAYTLARGDVMKDLHRWSRTYVLLGSFAALILLIILSFTALA